MNPSKSAYALLNAFTVLVLLGGTMTAMAFSAIFDPNVVIGSEMVGMYLGIEVLIYLFFFLAFFPRIDILTALLLTLVSVIIRVVLALAAATASIQIAHLDPATGIQDIWRGLWFGNPILSFLQVTLVAAAMVPFFAGFIRRFVGLGEAGEPAVAATVSPGASSVNLPMGGFLQCFSYQELNDYIRKLPDNIGFALASDEGLIVASEERGLPFPLESTVPRLQIGASMLKDSQRRSGMPVDELWQFSEEFTQLMIMLDPCFFLVIFFQPKVDLSDLHPRVTAVRKAADQFLSERHAPLMEEDGNA